MPLTRSFGGGRSGLRPRSASATVFPCLVLVQETSCAQGPSCDLTAAPHAARGALDRPSRTGDGKPFRGVAGAATQAGSGRAVRGARAHPRPGVAAGGWCAGRRRGRTRRRRRTKCGTLPLRPRRLMAGARAAHLFPRLSPGPGGFFGAWRWGGRAGRLAPVPGHHLCADEV